MAGARRRRSTHRAPTPTDIDVVGYPFLTWEEETRLFEQQSRTSASSSTRATAADTGALIREALARVPRRTQRDSRAARPERADGEGLRQVARLPRPGAARASSRATSPSAARRSGAASRARSTASGTRSSRRRSRSSACARKLKRVEHHLSHAANAYYTSGFDEALIVTLDGYGSGLAGSVSVGRERPDRAAARRRVSRTRSARSTSR